MRSVPVFRSCSPQDFVPIPAVTTQTVTLTQTFSATASFTKTFTATIGRRQLARGAEDESDVVADASHARRELDERSSDPSAAEPLYQASSPAPELECRQFGRVTGRASNGPVCSKCTAGIVFGTGSGAVQYCCPIRTTSTSTIFSTTTQKTTVTSTKTLSKTVTFSKTRTAT